jgi:hypothetical protein
MRTALPVGVLFALLGLQHSPVLAQYESTDPKAALSLEQAHTMVDAPRPELRAMLAETLPEVDGDVLNDPAWKNFRAAQGFIQTTPNEGMLASQRTELRVLYSFDTLYISVICFDDNPSGIVETDARRDVELDDSDAILVILDTYHDRQNGFVFGTNPAARQYDGQVTREGSGGGFGSSGGFNKNWDGVWQVQTQRGDYGWSAEFAIPFTTLRYRGRDLQNWGLNVQRNIRRNNETAYWAPLERQFDLFRVYDAGLLAGLAVPPQRNLQITPYVLSNTSDVGADGTSQDFEGGFDVKYSLTPALTLDLTYNTDFAQVEVDEEQINLDRFNLFFPEKRPFFLENAGQFTVGNPGNTELFFSRRIGISQNGSVIPIDYGARVSGKVDRTNVGFLYMRTDELDITAPADDFMVGRVSQEFDNRSSIGAIYVGRSPAGKYSEFREDNQAYGLDGRLGIGKYGLISGFVAQTSTPGLDGDDHAYMLKGEYDSEKWSWNVAYNEVGGEFNPETGFLKRRNFRSPSAAILRRIRPGPNRFNLHEIRPHASYSVFHNFDGFKESAFLHVDSHFEFTNSAEIHTAVNFKQDGLLVPFEIYDGIFVPAGTYHNNEFALVLQSNAGLPISYGANITAGGFFNGDRLAISPYLDWRIGDKFTSSLEWSRNDVDLDTGSFVTNLGRLRISWSFTPKLTLQALLQYNDVDESWSSNLRFSWLRSANTGLFIVFNDLQGFGDYSGNQPNRSLLVKYSYLFDVL